VLVSGIFRRWRAAPPSAPPGVPASGAGSDALGRALEDLIATVNRNSGRLPTAAVVNARALTDTLRKVLETSAAQPLDVHASISVQAIIQDYLPTTLRAYLVVEPELLGQRRASGHTPSESLLAQINSLQTAATGTLDAVRAQDADALIAQGSFLRTKFTRSDLDL
jgi:hypothetical protein